MSLLSRGSRLAGHVLSTFGAACSHLANTPDPDEAKPRSGEAKIDPRDPRVQQTLIQSWEDLHRAHGERRQSLLHADPKSVIAVEAYVFSMNPSMFATDGCLTWGKANGFTAFKSPCIAFLPERLFVNVMSPGLVYLNTIGSQGKDEGGLLIHPSQEMQLGAVGDAFPYCPLSTSPGRLGLPLTLPTETMQVSGTWSTLIPGCKTCDEKQWRGGAAYTLAFDFQGFAALRPDGEEILRRVGANGSDSASPKNQVAS